jgi:histidinol-phosphate/aromatic aminotransferase/cobyric acid decarboxylase-like protein
VVDEVYLDYSGAFPSDANFLLVQVDDARAVVQTMERPGINIRDRSGLPGIENCVCISIGTPEENNAMLSALEHYVAGRQLTASMSSTDSPAWRIELAVKT